MQSKYLDRKAKMKRTIPSSLIDDIENQECVVFLGAGTSTEHSYYSKKLIDVLSEKCSYPSSLPRNLPKIAQYFCKKMDGGLKGRLLREIREYLDAFMAYGEPYDMVTMVHRKIAEIGFFNIIITTNWDVFMERELNILPIVRDSDLVYWNDKKRQVIKLHDCVGQPETVVVTEDDYTHFMTSRLDSPIANKIRDLTATKTFLFVGYSLEDESFQLLQEEILSKMGRFTRCSYAVMRDPTVSTIESWSKKGVVIIPYNALAFVRDLHKTFVKRDVYFANAFLSVLADLHRTLSRIHSSTDQDDTIGLMSMMYQDGLQRGWAEVYYGIKLGKPKSHFKDQVRSFTTKLNKEFRGVSDPTEISYLRERIEFLKWALKRKDSVKMYLDEELSPITEEEFKQIRSSQKN